MIQRNLYETLLTQPGVLPGSGPPRPPRASAAVVLWRPTGGDLDGAIEVFWVRRSPQLEFMGGWHAFPGGGLSRQDAEVEVAGRPAGLAGTPENAGMPAIDAGTAALGPNDLPGIAACALRELFEETGVLPLAGVDPAGGQAARLATELADGRRRLLAGEISFGTLLQQLGLRPDAGSLVYAGRWLTPPLAPIRFDNRFFLLRWPDTAAVQPEVWPGELERGEWCSPAAADAAWRRGEVITSPPILHLLRVLADVGPAAGLARLRDPSEANLGPFRRVEFRPGVILLPLETPTLPPATHTNAFLLGPREVVLIDPGSPFPRQIAALREALAEGCQRLGLRVRAIWLTHHHPDHIGAVAEMRRTLAVPVCAHPLTAQRLTERGLPVDEELHDGQQVVLDGPNPMPVQVIHTPGHARGHLCFFDPTFGSLIAGDMVAGIGTIVIDPPEGDMDAYLNSLRKLIDLQPKTLFPAHGPTIAGAEARLREYLEHRLWREQRVLDAWNSGQRQPEAMVATVYDDVPAPAHPIAARQLAAHLERLRKLGRI